MAKKKQETKNNKKEKKEVVVKEEKVVKEVPKKESKKESKKDTKKVNKVNDDKVFKMLEFFDKYRLAIYGAVGGILITVLVVVIIWPDRIATLKDGTQPVAEIDGYTVTANDLYEDMKDVYSISSLLDKIDNKILEEKYPETDEMNDEYCFNNDIPVYDIYADGGTIVVKNGDLSIAITIPDDIEINSEYILNGI